MIRIPYLEALRYGREYYLEGISVVEALERMAEFSEGTRDAMLKGYWDQEARG